MSEPVAIDVILPPPLVASVVVVFGSPGGVGEDGLSAYQLALANGFTGTEAEWLASLQGTVGEDGLSAYQLALANGFTGTEAEWLASLQGTVGEDGLSAYQLALANGFTGTEAEWLASLQGTVGEDGLSAYQLALANGFTGTEAEWLASLQGTVGEDGLSAYEVALANGFTGTEAEWLASLVGATGTGGAALVTPGVFFVRTNGHDVTGDGSITKPFASLQRAVDVGEAYGPYVLRLGVGAQVASHQSFANLKAIHGEGADATAVTLFVDAAPSPDEGGTGGAGGEIEVELYHLRVSIIAGGGVGEHTGGIGGTIKARGQFSFANLGAEGGSNSTATQAAGGYIELSGATALGSPFSSSVNTGGSTVGALKAWQCDLRNLGTLIAASEGGNTAWGPSGPPGTDRGGNSSW